MTGLCRVSPGTYKKIQVTESAALQGAELWGAEVGDEQNLTRTHGNGRSLAPAKEESSKHRAGTLSVIPEGPGILTAETASPVPVLPSILHFR